MAASTLVPVAVPGSNPPGMVMSELLFAGVLLKAGDDNSRWKRRYFQLIALPGMGGNTSTNSRVRLQYFENDKDALKGKPCRGEISIADIGGLAVFANKHAPLNGAVSDAAVQACARLTSEHVHEGPINMMIWGRDRLWRLAEISTESNVIGELIRALDRTQLIPKLALRTAGWMRTQGTLNWNRRYAMLLSSGDLMLFRDATLEQLRRRIDLARAVDLKPLHPLAPAGSPAEKRVVRILAYSMSGMGASWDNEVSADGFELVGIRIRHPDIPEKRGYVMCVEASQADDAASHYGRFRTWIVQLQLSAAEARLSGFASRHVGESNTVSSGESEEVLERKLYQVVQVSSVVNNASITMGSREISIGTALPYLLRVGSFPVLWRSSLWFVLSGGALLRRTVGTPYSQLFSREEGQDCNELSRLSSALRRLDSHVTNASSALRFFLNFGGEEHTFWTFASLATGGISITSGPGSVQTLKGFFHPGFSSYVEAKVIVDLLGLAHPNAIAHLSAYDLLSTLLDACMTFTWQCQIPQVWDGICVFGKDALSFVAVSLLGEREQDMIICFSADDLAKVAENALSNQSVRIRWDQLDVRIVDQLRRAQWSAIVDMMREHSRFAGSWRSAAQEARSLGNKTIQQLNRLYPFLDPAEQSEEEVVERIHHLAIQVLSACGQVADSAERMHKRLDLEMQRSGYAGINDPLSKGVDDEINASGDCTADPQLLVKRIERFGQVLAALSWSCLEIGWKSWSSANLVAYGLCRFVPRASVLQSRPLLPPLLRSSSLDPQPQPLSNQQHHAQLATSAPSKAGPLQSLSPSASTSVSPSQGMTNGIEEIPAQGDVASFKSIAIGFGKRLFQQRFGTNDQYHGMHSTQLPQHPSLPTTTNSQFLGQVNPLEKAPSTPSLLQDQTPATLLKKFRGGFVGLVEQSGSAVDSALVRDAQLKHASFMRTLDILDVALKIATVSERLVRWMVARDQPVFIADLPCDLRKLFVASPANFNQEELKRLSACLSELTLCSTGLPSIF